MADDFIIKDIALAEFGRKEIAIAETEMPALRRCARNMAQRNR